MEVIISFDKDGFTNAKSNLLNIGQTIFEQALNQYSVLGLAELVAFDFPKFLTQPETFIFDKLTGGEFKINDLKISQQKAMEMIEKPKGYELFISAIKEIFAFWGKDQNWIREFNEPVTPKNINSFFELTEGMEIQLTKSCLSRLEAKFKIAAKSSAAIAVNDFANKVISLYNDLGMEKYFGGNGESMGSIVNEIIVREHRKPLKVNLDGVLRFNNIQG